MKTQNRIQTSHRSLMTYSGSYRGIWATVMALTFMVLATSTAWARLLDDFQDASRSDTIWIRKCFFGICEQVVTNGVVSLAITPSGDHGFSYLWSRERWILQEGKTLEFRADLVSSSGDGAMGYIAFALGDELRMYTLSLDQDTIALWKRANPLQLWYSENNTPRKVNNVKLVLSMTGIRSDVQLRCRVLDNDDGGAVLFEREFWDTPQKDPMARGDDTPAENFLNQSGLFEMSVYHDNAKLFDPETGIGPRDRAEVPFDNAEVFEYDSVWIDPPSNAVLLSWPQNTAEEQIVVGADAVEGPYAPWPEPVFKRQGRVCMTVEKTAAQQFFTLVPGTQFTEDFAPTQWPYSAKGEWVPCFWEAPNASRFTVNNENGSLRVHCQNSLDTGQITLLPPGPDVLVADFWASLDILDWSASSHSRSVGLMVRGEIQRDPFPGSSNGYIGELWFNRPGAAGTVSLNIFANADQPAGEGFDLEAGTRYRLVFFGVGTQLKLQVYKLLEVPILVMERSRTASLWSSGPVSLWLANYGGLKYDFIVDNFFVTGTKA